MISRVDLLGALVIGDIFHASCPNGASLICLVETITDLTIYARTVTHQIKINFSRETGVEIGKTGQGLCAIDSVAPLPVDLHNVIFWNGS